VCLPARLVSSRRKAQSAGESPDVVALQSELKGEGAENAGKEGVRVGQLDDKGSRRVVDDAGDSQPSKPQACRCAVMRSWSWSHTAER